MSKLRIRLNPYPDLKRNDSLYKALIEKAEQNENMSRLISKTRDKKKHIRLLQKEIQAFVTNIKMELAPSLQYYFKSKQVTVSALERGMLGDKHNNGKAEGFHIEVLDLLVIYITNDFKSNFFQWVDANSIAEISRFRTAFQIENNMEIISMESLYAIHQKTAINRLSHKNLTNNVRKEITIPTGKSFNSEILDLKERIYMELINDNFQEPINVLSNLIKQNNPDLYIAIITISGDLNDLNRREIIGQISPNDFRIGINMVKERIYKLADKVIK